MLNRIAIFDSGVGGIGILKLLENKSIAKEIIYYADNANVPFGTKSLDELIVICQNAVTYLESLDVDLIIFACNTASSLLPLLEHKVRIIPVSEYAIKGVLRCNNIDKLLVAGTLATLKSNLYQKICKDNNINADFISPIEFVPIVESMKFKDAENMMKEYFKNQDYSHVLFACTHYPFLYHEFKSFFNKAVFIDPAEVMADLLKKELNIFDENVDTKIIFKASKDIAILEKFYKEVNNV